MAAIRFIQNLKAANSGHLPISHHMFKITALDYTLRKLIQTQTSFLDKVVLWKIKKKKIKHFPWNLMQLGTMTSICSINTLFWRTLLHVIHVWQSREGIIKLMISHLFLRWHISLCYIKGSPHLPSRRYSTQAVFCYPEHKGFLHLVQTLIFLSCGTFLAQSNGDLPISHRVLEEIVRYLKQHTNSAMVLN